MNTFLIVALFVSSALAAPAEEWRIIRRAKKSPTFGTWNGGNSLAPMALYIAPQSNQFANMRENESEEMEPSARSYYDAGSIGGLATGASSLVPTAVSPPGLAAHSLGYGGPGLGYGGSALGYGGPVISHFPNAKVGNCAIPLLLSCSPNIQAGHLVHAAAHAPYAAPAYRTQDQKIEENVKPEMKDAELQYN